MRKPLLCHKTFKAIKYLWLSHRLWGRCKSHCLKFSFVCEARKICQRLLLPSNLQGRSAKLEVLSWLASGLCFILPVQETWAYPHNCSPISFLTKELQLLYRAGFSEFSIQIFSLEIGNKTNSSSLPHIWLSNSKEFGNESQRNLFKWHYLDTVTDLIQTN